MPKLWASAVDEHRRAVHATILNAAAELIAERGLAALGMSQIAQRAGIGRATLYKYFPDVEAVVTAWHQQQVAEHLRQVENAVGAVSGANEKLWAALETYARLSGSASIHGPERHDRDFDHRDAHDATRSTDLESVGQRLHHAGHVHAAHERLGALFADLIAAAVSTGSVRTDVPPSELAAYCVHALSAARVLGNPARERLVTVVVGGLRPITDG